MVRGNWQKRVESAQARRQAQKERKARKGIGSTYRAMASELIAALPEMADDDTLHVWVDSPPGGATGKQKSAGSTATSSRGVGGDGFDSDDGDGGGKRAQKKRQSRKKQQQGSSNKKAHPRQGLKHSHAEQDGEDDDDNAELTLCANHFFLNKCVGASAGSGGKGKRGKASGLACKLQHFRDPTLAFVLKKAPGSEADMKASAEAASVSTSEEDGISMLWYLSPSADDRETSGNDKDEGKPLNEVLQSCLSRNKIGAATIVYMVLGNRIVYDRNRGGLLEEGQNEDDDAMKKAASPITGEGIGNETRRRSRGDSFLADSTNVDQTDVKENIIQNFPGSVLETILVCLPSLYTGNLPLVCRSWSSEIGKTSPNLWRQLLLREGLPMPSSNIDPKSETSTFIVPELADATNARDIFRGAFIGHYEARRDMRAIRELLMKSQQGSTHEAYQSKEASVIDYNANPGTPRENSGPASSLKIWAEGKALIAYRDDCTVRLFETINTGKSLSCRQTVCACLSPDPKSKRGQWKLTGMDVDDQHIFMISQPGGLDPFHFADKHTHKVRSPHMLVVKRDDFLCASGGDGRNRPSEVDEDDVTMVDLREKLVDYFLKGGWASHSTEAMEREAGFVDYIQKHEDHSHLRLSVGPDIMSYGRGRVLIQVSFYFVNFGNIENQPSEVILADRLFLYSVKDRKFIWSLSNGEFGELREHAEDARNIGIDDNMRRSYWRKMLGGRIFSAGTSSSNGSLTALTFPTPTTQLLIKVRRKDGIVSFDSFNLLARLDTSSEMLVSPSQLRSASLTSSSILVAHGSFHRGRIFRSILTSSSMLNENDGDLEVADVDATSTLTMDNCKIFHIFPVGSDHVILCYKTYTDRRPNDDQDDADEEGEVENDIQGDWFGLADGEEDNDNSQQATEIGNTVGFALMHIPSQTEIGQYRIDNLVRGSDFHPILLSASCGTVAMCIGEGDDEASLSPRSLLMSGRGARQALQTDASGTSSKANEDLSNAKSKKKKKRLATHASGRNKDGFARGMSGRG